MSSQESNNVKQTKHYRKYLLNASHKISIIKVTYACVCIRVCVCVVFNLHMSAVSSGIEDQGSPHPLYIVGYLERS